MIAPVPELLREILAYVWSSGLSMGRYLALGLILAALLQSFVPSQKLHQLMAGHGLLAVIIASVAAVTTPLCSCGTVSIMIPLLAAGVPWGPIFAWLIASPVISPTGFALIGGTLGWHFAIAKVVAGLAMGVGGGVLANWLQGRGALAGQSRVPLAWSPSGPCTPPGDRDGSGCGSACCGPSADQEATSQGEVGAKPGSSGRLKEFGDTLWSSARSLVPLFVLFIFVAGAIEVLVPTEWVAGLFGAGRAWGVPAAAVLGVPLYTSAASAVPLVSTLVNLGMSSGAALALILTGPGTSLPALGALLVIARVRLLALYLAVLFTSSIAFSLVFGLGWP